GHPPSCYGHGLGSESAGEPRCSWSLFISSISRPQRSFLSLFRSQSSSISFFHSGSQTLHESRQPFTITPAVRSTVLPLHPNSFLALFRAAPAGLVDQAFIHELLVHFRQCCVTQRLGERVLRAQFGPQCGSSCRPEQ